MRLLRKYSIQKAFDEGGKVQSFALPVDCERAQGVLILPQLPDLPIPNGKAFFMGTLSVLLNNRNDNALHDYPLYAYPDKNGKMSLGDHFSLEKQMVALSTPLKPGELITLVYKDSGYMKQFIASDPDTYTGYDFDIDLWFAYNDKRGDWSNNEIKTFRLIHEET